MVLLALPAVLSSCSSGIAYSVTADELLGQWNAGSDAILTTSSDGTFTAENWPSNLLCGEPSAVSKDDIDWNDRITFSGTWSAPTEKKDYSLQFFNDVNDCQQSSWSADAWDLGSGRLSLKLFLDFSVDPDDVPDEKIYWLDKVK
ncbi:hypothetical protein [Microbacterium sp. NPDC057944]|uniref:hypothetical protein n=1 Tax=Microbacterium sp. NPDC057944 TaxID=3346286 RepID=UPI0036D8A1E9